MDSDLSYSTAQSERRRTPYAASGSSKVERPAPAPVSEPHLKTTEEERLPGEQPQPNRRQYRPRTCRICLETENPKFHSDVASALGISRTSSRPVYESDDPELGRLLSPCKCKGSSKYVHEGCLDAWRLTDPTAARNFWQCPTCKFNYRLARLHWATKLSSKWAQIALTAVVFIVSLFVLGFIADPILDLWIDPVGSIADMVSNVVSDPDAVRPPPYQESATWLEHFYNGFISLGLIGVIKSLIALGPWHWINFRIGGLFGFSRRGAMGRNRMNNNVVLFVLIGAFTFMMALWQFVKAMSARVLTQVSNKVMDVGDDDDDDDDDDQGPTSNTRRSGGANLAD